MINADSIFARWQRHADALATPVRDIHLPSVGMTFTDNAYQMGVVNFSKDSSYRESVVYSEKQARYRCDRLVLEGAKILDLGGESVFDHAARVDAETQLGMMLPTSSRVVLRQALDRVGTRTVGASAYEPHEQRLQIFT